VSHVFWKLWMSGESFALKVVNVLWVMCFESCECLVSHAFWKLWMSGESCVLKVVNVWWVTCFESCECLVSHVFWKLWMSGESCVFVGWQITEMLLSISSSTIFYVITKTYMLTNVTSVLLRNSYNLTRKLLNCNETSKKISIHNSKYDVIF